MKPAPPPLKPTTQDTFTHVYFQQCKSSPLDNSKQQEREKPFEFIWLLCFFAFAHADVSRKKEAFYELVRIVQACIFGVACKIEFDILFAECSHV